MFPARILTTIRAIRPLLHFSDRQPQFRREFHITPLPQAAENPDAFITTFKHTAIFRKLADKPDALKALTHFAKLMQDQGVDFTSGAPSTIQMMKLAANPEFREGARRVVEEMKKAGVDFNSKEVMDEIMNLKKPGGGLGGS